MTRPGTFPRVAVTIVAACLAGIVGLTSQTTPADAATGRPICSHGTVNISGDRYLAHSWDEREYAVRRSADGVWRRTWVSNTHHYDVMQRRRLRPAKFVAVWPSHGCPRH